MNFLKSEYYIDNIEHPYSAPLAGPPLCCTCWNPGLPLPGRPLLLWLLCSELHSLLCPWLNHWSWSLAVNTLPCRRLWQRRWVVEIALLSHFSQIGRRHSFIIIREILILTLSIFIALQGCISLYPLGTGVILNDMIYRDHIIQYTPCSRECTYQYCP